MGCRKDGTCFPMEMGMSQMQIGEQTFTIGCIRDISGRKAYTEALEHRALHDELTGLPNRTLFADRLERAIASAERSDEPRGVLVVDLDEFREVNEDVRTQDWRRPSPRGRRTDSRRDARIGHRSAPGRRRLRHPPVRRDRR